MNELLAIIFMILEKIKIFRENTYYSRNSNNNTGSNYYTNNYPNQGNFGYNYPNLNFERFQNNFFPNYPPFYPFNYNTFDYPSNMNNGNHLNSNNNYSSSNRSGHIIRSNLRDNYQIGRINYI